MTRAIAALVLAGSLLTASAAEARQVEIATKASPGVVLVRSKPIPRRFNPDVMWIRINRKNTPVADYRDCAVDAARNRAMVTIDVCDKRHLVVTTVSTAKRPVKVWVKLAER